MQGNVLVYLIVLILIFGVLGVTIISLFTTATSSSATPNNARRAAYVTESAMRYALSELRNSGFDTGVVDSLNTTTYTVNSTGSFSLNIFAPWFVATENYSFGEGGGTLTLNVPVGKLTAGWMAKDLANVWVVNYDYLNINRTTARDGVASWAMINDSTLTVTVNGDIIVNQGERICFMVKPYGDPAAFGDDGDLEVRLQAKDFFPQSDGVININGFDYVYKKLIVGADRVTLKNISASDMPNKETPPSSLDLSADDFIVLSPRNYFIIPSGRAGAVLQGGELNAAMNIYNQGQPPPMSSASDIDAGILTNNITKLESATDFIEVDTVDETLNIGGGASTPGSFGAAWFDADMTIGGKQQVCSAGACEFGLGVRVFFIVDASAQGDGFTFALINSNNNDRTSVGGDIDMGELMAFAGDSRTIWNPSVTTDFLDGKGEGLEPPKIALEFDLYSNNLFSRLCADNTTVNDNTRNDPPESILVDDPVNETADNRDVLQFVYWGSQTLVMPCRPNGNVSTYDDNRHDAEAATTGSWEFTTGGNVQTSPALGADETIYFGDDDKKFYALNPDDRVNDLGFPTTNEFTFTALDKIKSSPAVGSDGTIYFGSDDGFLRALYSDGTSKWSYDIGDKVQSSPALDEANGMIYVGSDDGKVYGFDLAGNLQWSYNIGQKITTKPAVGPGGKIYVVPEDYLLWAFNHTDRMGDSTGAGPLNTATEFTFEAEDWVWSSPTVSSDGTTIYVGTWDKYVYALNRNDRINDATGKTLTANEWRFRTGDPVQSQPALDEANGIIYVGSDDDSIYALKHSDRLNDATENTLTANEWSYKTEGDIRTRPAIAADGNVYVGSEKSRVYAFNPADRLMKETFPAPSEWEFTADGNVKSSPVVGTDAVYVGSDGGKGEGKFYAIQSFAFPRNERGTLISYSDDFKLDPAENPTQAEKDDWLAYNDYAVRMEIKRSPNVNGNGNYEYTSRAWIRRCQNEKCPNTDTDPKITGTFFQDTRIEYAWFPAPNSFIQQTIEMTPVEHAKFDRTLFGFTAAIGDIGPQNILIKKFQLSFIRPNDPVVTDDSTNYPVPP